MSISEHKHMSNVEGVARRIEIFTGSGRRRSWSAEEKAAIVAESRESGARVAQVARRHGLTAQQLFTWRRQERSKAAAAPAFVPAVVDAEEMAEKLSTAPTPQSARPHSIELDIAGTSVFIWGDADPLMVSAIIGVLKAAR